jgi:hypothetical protein
MMALEGLIRIALTYYASPITIQDVTYTATSGEDVQALSGAARTINAVVDLSNKQQMEYLFGGSVSDGDVMIYTFSSDTIYIDDIHSSSATRKQSFYTDGSNVFRISGIADWSSTGMKIYLAKYHVKQSVF